MCSRYNTYVFHCLYSIFKLKANIKETRYVLKKELGRENNRASAKDNCLSIWLQAASNKPELQVDIPEFQFLFLFFLVVWPWANILIFLGFNL